MEWQMNFFDPEYRIIQTIENSEEYVIQRRKWYSFFWNTLVRGWSSDGWDVWKFFYDDDGYSCDKRKTFSSVKCAQNKIDSCKVPKGKKNIIVSSGR